jgi:hypothetical protein
MEDPMIYPDLFRQLEAVRWSLEDDIPWSCFDDSLLTEEQAVPIKMNAITEWSALPATEMFLRDNRDDSDFSAFMSDLVLRGAEALAGADGVPARFRPDSCRPRRAARRPLRVRAGPALETLMLHFCGEIRLNHWYRRAAEWHTEPVIQAIYDTLAATRRATAAPTCAT